MADQTDFPRSFALNHPNATKPGMAQEWIFQMGDSVAVITIVRRLAEILIAGLCLSLSLSLLSHYLHPTFSAQVPRVLENGKRRFSWRTRWLLYTDADRIFHEAYQKVSYLTNVHESGGNACAFQLIMAT